MTEPTAHLKPLVDALHQNGRLRVWSLVVTVLGDVVAPRGGQILMSDLLVLMNHLGVPDGAVRTALSRLAKDEWVQSERQGRTSRYSFGPKGQAQFAPAEARIYADPDTEISDNWCVLVPRHGPASFVAAVTPATVASARTQENLILSSETPFFPDWVSSHLTRPTDVSDLDAFMERYRFLAEPHETLPPIDALCARILLVHDWRRLALRIPSLPPALQPKDWNLPKAHRLTAQAYGTLLANSENYWETPPLAEGLEMLKRRFNRDT